jgi:hypothetical protein
VLIQPWTTVTLHSMYLTFLSKAFNMAIEQACARLWM